MKRKDVGMKRDEEEGRRDEGGGDANVQCAPTYLTY